MTKRYGLFSVLLPMFLALLPGSIAAESYVYPAFYCTWYSLSERPEGDEPRSFAVFGKRPTVARRFPSVRLTDGEETIVWIAVEDRHGKWSKREASLATSVDAKKLTAELDFLPISIFFRKRTPGPNVLYFARAYYGDPRDEREYICHVADIGLPGGAMSGGN